MIKFDQHSKNGKQDEEGYGVVLVASAPKPFQGKARAQASDQRESMRLGGIDRQHHSTCTM